MAAINSRDTQKKEAIASTSDKRDGLHLTIPAMKIVAPPRNDGSEIKSRLASLLVTLVNPSSHQQRLARTESAIPSNASCDGMADLSREEFPPVEKIGRCYSRGLSDTASTDGASIRPIVFKDRRYPSISTTSPQQSTRCII